MPSDDPDTPVVSLRISANVQITFGFQPALISLGDIQRGDTITRSLQVIGKEAQGVKLTSAKANRQFDVVMKQREDDAGKRYVDFSLTAKSDVPLETNLSANIEVQTNNAKIGVVQLSARGYVVGAITARPHRAYARVAKAGAPVRLRFEVLSPKQQAFKILGVEDSAGRFTAKATAVQERHRYSVLAEIPVDKVPTATQSGLVTVRTDHPQVGSLEVPYTIAIPRQARAPAPVRSRQPPPPAAPKKGR